MAKKFGEEAIEVVVSAMQGDRDNIVRESADLLYNMMVLWVATGVAPKDVWAEMERREQLFGIAEKRLKDFAPKQRRKVTTSRHYVCKTTLIRPFGPFCRIAVVALRHDGRTGSGRICGHSRSA